MNCGRRYQEVPEPDVESRSVFLADRIKEFRCDLEHEATFNFLTQQCQLFTTSPDRRRYSVETLILSFTYFHKSNACCSELQKMFCVPSKRTLRRISSNLSVHSMSDIFKAESRPEVLFNLMLDEIHIKPKVSYQGGKTTGTADNHSEVAAIRIQAFMVVFCALQK